MSKYRGLLRDKEQQVMLKPWFYYGTNFAPLSCAGFLSLIGLRRAGEKRNSVTWSRRDSTAYHSTTMVTRI